MLCFFLVAVVKQLSSEIPAHSGSAGGHGGDAAEVRMEGDGESECFPWSY